MTVNRTFNSSDPRKPGFLTIAVVAIFAIAAIFLTRPVTSLQSLSPVSGLMTLKAAAQTAMPYEVAIANPQPTLIEFYADWCTTCQAMAPTLQSVHEQFGDRTNFVMLNIDDPQWQPQIKQFGVSGVPHLVLLNGDQTSADAFIGKVPKSVLAQRLTDWLG
ncbi:MAG: thioredoxin domain-containing protein [Cyanobacteria bacterium J06638_28]